MPETSELGPLLRAADDGIAVRNPATTLPNMPAELPNIAITGFAYHTGDLVITVEQKAQTIASTKEDLDRIIATAKNGLKLVSSSVANKGETPITAAAMAELKLNLAFGEKATETKKFKVGTENPRGVSSNDAGPIADSFNRMSRLLKMEGVDVGQLKDLRFTTHSQSACVPAVAMATEMAEVGTASQVDIVGPAKAYYPLGSAADMTGAFGASAIRIKPSRRGLILLPFTGREGGVHPDFDKLINLFSTVEKTGVSRISEYPIVFGKYSEYVYMYDVFGGMSKALGEAGIDLNRISPYQFFDKFVLVPHLPHAQMPEKSLANLVEHFMHIDKKFAGKVFGEVEEAVRAMPPERRPKVDHTKIPYIDGLSSQRESFKFVADVAGLVLTLEQAKKSFALTNDDPTLRMEDLVDMRSLATLMVAEMVKFREDFGITREARPELRALFSRTEKRLERIAEHGGTLDDVIGAFSEIYENDEEDKGRKTTALINTFMRNDRAFSGLVRQTPTYKELEKKAHLREITYLSARNGNIYPGSAHMALISTVAHVPPEELATKIIVQAGYGSGDETYVMMLMPSDLETMRRMHEVAKRMINYDEQHRVEIDAQAYIRVRSEKDTKDYVGVRPILRDVIPGFNMPDIDQEALPLFAREYSAYVNRGVMFAERRPMERADPLAQLARSAPTAQTAAPAAPPLLKSRT